MNHPVIDLDQELIDEIASSMDLRPPNKEALEAVAERFATSDGEPFECVTDMATAVGKTYLAGALIEYLARSGVRNFLIVVPGRTILTKTIGNFTPGYPKSVLGGMTTDPLLITSENFNTGATGTALHDETLVKLFVFTVQSLIRPTDKVTRRTRAHQEWLGEDLYQYLKERPDLVVIADEHHVIQEKAEKFSDAVRDLDALALVGLTATPAESDKAKIIYKYPLARAIADRWVKTPVLVGRKDNVSDTETRLRDGLLLLEAKQKAIDEYVKATWANHVNAVMFIVAGSIDSANDIADVLKRPGLFSDDYEEAVLTVHSDAPDDALARLAAVEDPESKVRCIVSVAMLKEGWDVSSIFVLSSFRRSISEVLTEQTLGRGLRLPWGNYTGVELLDTLEVLSHERYEQLLAKAGTLLEGLVEERVAEPVVIPAPIPGATPSGDSVAVTGAVEPSEATSTTAGQDGGDLPEGASGFVLTSLDERTDQANSQVASMSQEVAPTEKIRFPEVTYTVTAPASFSLSTVDEAPFAQLGTQLGGVGATDLARKVLDVKEDPSAPTGYRLVPREAAGTVAASAAHLPFGGALKAIKDTILSLDVVNQTVPEINAAGRLAIAVVKAAGGDDALAANLNAALNAARLLVLKAYKAIPPVTSASVDETLWGDPLLNTREVDPNRFGDPFSSAKAYSGWKRGMYPLAWFDSRPERSFANLVDADPAVELWARIRRGDLVVRWERGRYSPDFYVRAGGQHYLTEIKADKDAQSDVVKAKAKAAADWARYVTDHGGFASWSYVLIPESVLKIAHIFAEVLRQAPSAS
jgi:type III restriction enzyme